MLSNFIFIIIVLLLSFSINVIDCDHPIPTLSSVRLLYDYNKEYPYIEIYGDNFITNNQSATFLFNGHFLAERVPQVPMNMTYYRYNLPDVLYQNTYLVDTTVSVCGALQFTCNQANQTMSYKSIPFCNQNAYGWMVDAGTPTITITGAAFPTKPIPGTESQVVFKRYNSDTLYPSTISYITSNVAIINLHSDLVSGNNYFINSFKMNGVDVYNDVFEFDFIPPTIKSFYCYFDYPKYQYMCIMNGTSFGLTSTAIYIKVVMNNQWEIESKGVGNGIGSIIIPKPINKLLLNGFKTLVLSYDGCISKEFNITTSFIDESATQPPPKIIKPEGTPGWNYIFIVVIPVITLGVVTTFAIKLLRFYLKNRPKEYLKNQQSTQVPPKVLSQTLFQDQKIDVPPNNTTDRSNSIELSTLSSFSPMTSIHLPSTDET